MSPSKKLVFVTGSIGRIGREVVARLSKFPEKFQIRAGIRGGKDSDANSKKVEFLKKISNNNIEIVDFDYTDPGNSDGTSPDQTVPSCDKWNDALQGVNVVYSASLDPLLEHHLKFAKYLGAKSDSDSSSESSIEHIIRISCMGADTNTACYNKDKHVTRANAGIPLMLQHYWWGEKCFVDAGLESKLTVLRNNFFMNHLLKTDCENIGPISSSDSTSESTGFFSNPLGDSRNSFVSTSDIGEAAAKIIEQGPSIHGNKFYDLTGPEPQSMYEIAEDLSYALNRKITYKPQDMVTFEKDFGSTRAEFFEYLCNGFYTRCSPDFYNIIGRRPTTYREYLMTKTASGVTGLEELYEGNLWKKGVDAMKDAAKVK